LLYVKQASLNIVEWIHCKDGITIRRLDMGQTFIERHADKIRGLARKHGVVKLRVFGSFATGEANETSDLDLLVRFGPGKDLLDLVALKQDLEALLGRQVDVVEEEALSPYIRDKVLQEARTL
jgi:predicted nucleotidyltransferase